MTRCICATGSSLPSAFCGGLLGLPPVALTAALRVALEVALKVAFVGFFLALAGFLARMF
jgi:hypothetical protein